MFNFLNSIKLTPSQATLLHTLESLLVTAIIAGFTAGWQFLATDNINLNAIIIVAVAAFMGSLVRGYTTTIRSSNGNILQAIMDTLNELQQAIAPVEQHVTPPAQPIAANPYLPMDARQQIATQPAQRNTTSDYQTMKMPAVQPPAWIHPSEATAPTEMPIHFGDTGVIPTV